ncbi:MAG: hypothetical protein JWL77_1321 [Chthonomonadaceae bacterium]|nr:hypothetical protein [Chthonomonadaceae bacterium]
MDVKIALSCFLLTQSLMESKRSCGGLPCTGNFGTQAAETCLK